MATRGFVAAARTLRLPRLPRAPRALRALSTTRSVRQLAAARIPDHDVVPPAFKPPVNDNDVRELFDTAYTPRTAEPTGLFTLGALAAPESLPALTERTLVHAQAVVDRISRAPEDTSGRELRLVVKNLDRLSDLLCGVIDMCELVRNAHPDTRWVDAADRTYERLCSYMNGLNTDRGLFLALVATLEAEHSPPLSHAERQVALSFLRDFEKSGIDLPPSVRARFVELSDSLLSLGRTFLSNASSGPATNPPIEFPDAAKLLDGLPPSFVHSLPQRKGTALVTPGSYEAQVIQRYAREGEARRLAYVGNNVADPERIGVLEEMLAQRAELAGVLGRRNWAEVALVDKMAKTPENVNGFLSSLAEHHRESAGNDIGVLQRLKGSALTGIHDKDVIKSINAWDRDYFTEKHVQSLAPASLPPLAPYFSTGTVMRGLSRLFSRLYGISFRPAPVAPGEVWHPSVRRLDVVDETEGTIGVIYCDLFSREGKPPNAAHYTVRCSRRVDDDDVAGDRMAPGWDASWGPGLETPGSAVRGKDGKYQLPIVVLTTDFGEVERGRPALLGWHEVETLFHEMGHAMHCEYRGAADASDDRTDGVPQCVWDAVCDRLCRAAIYPHGALCQGPRGAIAVCRALPDWRAAADAADGRAHGSAAELCRARDARADCHGPVGPAVPLSVSR